EEHSKLRQVPNRPNRILGRGSGPMRVVALLTCHAKNTLILQKHLDRSPTTPILLVPERDPRRKLSKTDIAQIVNAYEAGQSRKQVSESHSISRARVSQILRWHGVESRMRQPTDKEVEEMTVRYGAGDSLATIGTQLGFDPVTVRKYLLQRGVVIRSPAGV